jgi:hypothetical protein
MAFGHGFRGEQEAAAHELSFRLMKSPQRRGQLCFRLACFQAGLFQARLCFRLAFSLERPTKAFTISRLELLDREVMVLSTSRFDLNGAHQRGHATGRFPIQFVHQPMK